MHLNCEGRNYLDIYGQICLYKQVFCFDKYMDILVSSDKYIDIFNYKLFQ